MDLEDFFPLIAIVAFVLAIPIAVWGLFKLGSVVGVEWYVSAVSILLMARALFLVFQMYDSEGHRKHRADCFNALTENIQRIVKRRNSLLP